MERQSPFRPHMASLQPSISAIRRWHLQHTLCPCGAYIVCTVFCGAGFYSCFLAYCIGGQHCALRAPDPIPFVSALATFRTVGPLVASQHRLSSGSSLLLHLRRAARELGGRWPRLTASGLSIDELRTESSDSGDDAEWTQWVAVIILIPGYLPEQLTVVLRLPATLAYTVEAVNAARAPEQATRFPVLQAARPQPVPGAAVFLALPPWDTVQVLCCFDLTRVDGRIFSRQVPPYITRTYLLQVASVAQEAGVDVRVGDCATSLAYDASAYLDHGDTIQFWPTTVIPQELPLLENLLVGFGDWIEHVQLPAVAGPAAYYLVRYDEATLFHTDQARPTQYRHQIAQLLGAPLSELVLQPACPRASDAAIDGHTCLSVIAVGCASVAVDPVFVLLDCRPLLQGWAMTEAPDGYLRIAAVTGRLEALVPPGYEPVIHHVPPGAAYYRVAPGTVLTVSAQVRPPSVAEVAPTRGPTLRGVYMLDDSRQAAARPSLDTRHATGHNPVAVDGLAAGEVSGREGPSVQETAAGPPVPTPASGVADDPASDSAVTVEDQPPAPSSSAIDIGVFTATPFYIFSQEYMPEWVSVRLPAAVSVPTALCLVHAAREPAAAERFPILHPVHPQPCRQAALLLARPTWDSLGVHVLLDCREVGGSFFALLVPPRITRQALLSAAGLEATDALSMFVRTMPWPMPEGYPFELGHGDLVQVVPAQAFAYFQSDLPALLRQPDGWDGDWILPGDYEERAWVVAADRQLCYSVPPTRRQHLRNDLAQVLAIPARRLALSPAREPLGDHAYRGRLIRHLYAAACLSEAVRRRDREPICLLDLRPIMLSFAWYYAPAGTLQHGPLLARFEPRAPEGYVLGFTRRDSPIARLQAPLLVSDGEVVALHFFIPPPADISSTEDEGDVGPRDRDRHRSLPDADGSDAVPGISAGPPGGVDHATPAASTEVGRQRGLRPPFTTSDCLRRGYQESAHCQQGRAALAKYADVYAGFSSVGAAGHAAANVTSSVAVLVWASSRVVTRAFSSCSGPSGRYFCLPASVLLGLHAIFPTGAVAALSTACLVCTVFSLLRKGRYALALLLLLWGGCLANPVRAGVPRHVDYGTQPLSTLAEGASCLTIAAGTAASLRRLPTPCRANRVEIGAATTTLCTLLQESAAHTDTWAFNAATLLETLIEHFQGQMPSPAAPGRSSLPPRCLLLSEVIPRHSTSETLSRVGGCLASLCVRYL